jgi:hypothetical protein
MTLYSQRDSRWKNQKFGKDATIGVYGCTLTCIAMMLDITPDIVARKLDEANAFSGNLIIWQRVEKAFPQLKYVKRNKTYNNEDVKKNLPCLVEVDFDGTPRIDQRHWVLFKGNQKMYDPWTGKELSTSFYSPLIGYAIFRQA